MEAALCKTLKIQVVSIEMRGNFDFQDCGKTYRYASSATFVYLSIRKYLYTVIFGTFIYY